MLRDIETAIDQHHPLRDGLSLWQWNIFGYWHFGQDDISFNAYSLREDRLTTLSAGPNRWQPYLGLLSSGCFRVEPTPTRDPLPRTVLGHLIRHDRRQAEPLVRELSADQPWRPATVETKPPLVKVDGRGRWNRPVIT